MSDDNNLCELNRRIEDIFRELRRSSDTAFRQLREEGDPNDPTWAAMERINNSLDTIHRLLLKRLDAIRRLNDDPVLKAVREIFGDR